MKLPVNEIFYSLQGEGLFTGTPATFIRLAGCNLSCPFCDTNHKNGVPRTVEYIVGAALRNPSRNVIVTGGEPSLHALAPLVDALHENGFFVQVETNGTNPLPDTIDFITCSPKDVPVKLSRIDEVKLLFLPRYLDNADDSPELTLKRLLPPGVEPRRYALQPCDTGEPYTNSRILEATVDYILRHPQWHLSLQTHKLINIP